MENLNNKMPQAIAGLRTLQESYDALANALPTPLTTELLANALKSIGVDTEGKSFVELVESVRTLRLLDLTGITFAGGIPQSVSQVLAGRNEAIISIVDDWATQIEGNYAFANMRSLKSVTLNKCEVISGSHPFDGCISLEEVNLPKLLVTNTLGDGVNLNNTTFYFGELQHIDNFLFINSRCHALVFEKLERGNIINSSLSNKVDIDEITINSETYEGYITNGTSYQSYRIMEFPTVILPNMKTYKGTILQGTYYDYNGSRPFEIIAPELTDFTGTVIDFNSYGNKNGSLRRIYMPKLNWMSSEYTILSSKTASGGNNKGASVNPLSYLEDIEVGELNQNISLRIWVPTYVDTQVLNDNIKNHIAAKIADRTDQSALTITFATQLYTRLTDETKQAFYNKNWNIAQY